MNNLRESNKDLGSQIIKYEYIENVITQYIYVNVGVSFYLFYNIHFKEICMVYKYLFLKVALNTITLTPCCFHEEQVSLKGQTRICIPITSKVAISFATRGEVYSIQLDVVKFVSDVSYLQVLRLPPSIKLTTTIFLKMTINTHNSLTQQCKSIYLKRTQFQLTVVNMYLMVC